MDLTNEMLALLPRKKQTPNGWISFNAVCCQHNGETRDTKRRGGLLRTSDGGTTYHCFNCGYKTSWKPGRPLSKKMRNLLAWLGASDDQIKKITLECLKTEVVDPDTLPPVIANMTPRDLPENSQRITEDLVKDSAEVIPIVEYLYSRGLTLDDTDFYWSDSPGYADRLIIPFYSNNILVGYIARKITDGKPKYITERPAHAVFNLDNQTADKQFVLVFEGVVDALMLEGVAVLSNEISPEQALQINSLGKQVIVVPDQDKPGEHLIRDAVDLKWSVSFPNWGDGVKDAADAVCKYGKLTTMLSIVKNIETNPLKINLRMKL